MALAGRKKFFILYSVALARLLQPLQRTLCAHTDLPPIYAPIHKVLSEAGYPSALLLTSYSEQHASSSFSLNSPCFIALNEARAICTGGRSISATRSVPAADPVPVLTHRGAQISPGVPHP